MKYRSSCKRIVKFPGGEKREILIPVLTCCGKYKRDIPDWLVPFKHYTKETIEKAANAACKELAPYVLQVIIEFSSYDKLNARYNIPCGRRQFYQAYRRYFWYLDKMLKGNLLTQEA